MLLQPVLHWNINVIEQPHKSNQTAKMGKVVFTTQTGTFGLFSDAYIDAVASGNVTVKLSKTTFISGVGGSSDIDIIPVTNNTSLAVSAERTEDESASVHSSSAKEPSAWEYAQSTLTKIGARLWYGAEKPLSNDDATDLKELLAMADTITAASQQLPLKPEARASFRAGLDTLRETMTTALQNNLLREGQLEAWDNCLREHVYTHVRPEFCLPYTIKMGNGTETTANCLLERDFKEFANDMAVAIPSFDSAKFLRLMFPRGSQFFSPAEKCGLPVTDMAASAAAALSAFATAPAILAM